MIIVCPGCGRRYRIDPAHVERGVRLRCTGCRKVFASQPASAARGGPAPRPEASPGPAANRPPDSGPPLVVIGDENRPFRVAAEQAASALGCQVKSFEDGGAAFQFAVGHRPALMLLNLRLKGLSGAAVCEGIKGSPHLQGIKVALVGSTIQPGASDGAARKGREPDDAFEDTIGEEELRRRIGSLLGHAGSRHGAGSGALSVAPAAGHAAAGAEGLEPRAEIRRLARIMLSDLKLYNPERFAVAVRDGRLLDNFRDELMRGKDLITTRFPSVADRVALLTTALREGIEEERAAAGLQRAGTVS